MMKTSVLFLFLGIGLLLSDPVFSQDFLSSLKDARDYYEGRQYQKALEICSKILPVLEKQYGTEDTLYLNFYRLSGNCYRSLGQYEKAQPVFEMLTEIHKRTQGLNEIYATDLSGLADCYSNLGDYNRALPLLEEAKNIMLNIHGAKHPEYARAISELATLWYIMGRYKDALQMFEDAVAIEKESLGTRNARYAADLSNAGMSYKKLGKFETALSYLLEANAIYKELKGINDPDYASSLSYLAGLFISMGKYEEALPLYQETRRIRYETLGPGSNDYASSLNNLGFLYIRMGNYDAALPLYREANAIRREQLGTTHIDYASSLNNLASIYWRMGDFKSALPLYENASSIYRERLGPKHPDYATSLNNRALLLSEMGNFTEALPLYEEASAIDWENPGKLTPEYATDLLNLANLYSAMGNDSTGLPLLLEASAIYKQISGPRHPDYALSLNALARLYNSMHNYQASIPLLREAADIYRESFGTGNIDYAVSIKNLAVSCKETGNYDTALILLKEASGTFRQVLGAFHPDYAYSLNNLARIYIALGNPAVAQPLMEEANTIINRNIQNNFSFISREEKEKYLKLVSSNYDVYRSFFLDMASGSPEICGRGYDNELLLKGLILSSVTAMQQSILESGDTALINLYERMRAIKRQIINCQHRAVKDRHVDLALLEKQANQLEKELTQRSQVFSETQSSFRVNREDVRKKLSENEAAVEFVNFRYYDAKRLTDSIFYCAFVLKRNDSLPFMVYLCEENQLKAAIPPAGASFRDINACYMGNRLYELVWQPLENLMKGVSTVYFAPSGLLNSIAMAALTGPGNEMLMEKYRLVQLTSTRNLVLPAESAAITTAVVYGGIVYDTDTTTLLKEALKFKKEEPGIQPVYRSDAGLLRGGFRYLPGTLKEADMVSSRLKEAGIASTSYSGTEAVEESFMNLSGQNAPSLIHLSTHGFYYPALQQKENSGMVNAAAGESRFRFSDDPLQRSGLLLAGANLAWKGAGLPPDVEDGILTAKEVSNLNLMKTQLVVLSACQTGQGEVKGSEGVEGLQRGFKMAGARNIIMSLWEVPDKETTAFMDLFYSKWLGGEEIHNAFRDTQLSMRNNFGNEPSRWAAFVLTE